MLDALFQFTCFCIQRFLRSLSGNGIIVKFLLEIHERFMFFEEFNCNYVSYCVIFICQYDENTTMKIQQLNEIKCTSADRS